MVRIELRGQESNLRTRGSKPRISTDRNYPAINQPEGRAGLEPARWYLTGTCSAAELPTRINSALRESSPPVQLRWQESNLRPPGSKPDVTTNSDYPASGRVPCGSRTRLARLEAWSLCRSAKDTSYFQRKVRQSNPSRRSSRSTAFEAAAVTSRLALP